MAWLARVDFDRNHHAVIQLSQPAADRIPGRQAPVNLTKSLRHLAGGAGGRSLITFFPGERFCQYEYFSNSLEGMKYGLRNALKEKRN